MTSIKKIAATYDGHKYFIKDEKNDLHTQFGMLSCKEFKRHEAKTNTGKRMCIYKATFADKYSKIKRGPQIVPLKDISFIIAKTGMGKNSIVVDSGSGSGGTSLAFANIAKKVHSFDIREDFHNICKKNKETMGLKNVEYSLHDITTGIPVKGADIVFLDIPNPWLVVPYISKTLKRGGFLVSYSPTVPQVMDYIDALKESKEFITTETVEIFEREWELEGRKVRPKSQRIGHSGFLTFTRFVG